MVKINYLISMKKWLIPAMILLVIISCKNNSAEPQVNIIMPLGASRVQGSPPAYLSYRYNLWKKLRLNGYNIDFIGGEVDGEIYPLVNEEEFDPHHEGHSGWTSGQLLSDLPNWTARVDTPDIVLFSSPGGNDIIDGLSYESAIENVVDIVQGLQAFNPEVTVVLEKMAPGHSLVMMIGPLGTNHARLLNDIDSLASSLTTISSEVLVIDMATGFTDNMLADPIHYNQDGATFIADRYYSLLETILD